MFPFSLFSHSILLILLLTFPLHAAGGDISEFGFSAMWQVYAVVFPFALVSLVFFWMTFRHRRWMFIIPGLLVGGICGFFLLGAHMLGAPVKTIYVMGVYGGLSVSLEDTVLNEEGWKKTYGRINEDSSDLFVIKRHLDKVTTYGASLSCFNLYTDSLKAHFSSETSNADKIKIITIIPWTRVGWEGKDIDYDIKVVKTDSGYTIVGWIGNIRREEKINITGTYLRKRKSPENFFVPPDYPNG